MGLLLCSVGFSAAAWAADCSAWVGRCDYYECRESLHPCGAQGYYLGFGDRICRKSFTDLSRKVSPVGQVWLEDVATCLQHEMESIPIETSCQEVYRAAIAGHSQCYLETGFCDLSISDQLTILTLVGRELGNPGVFQQGMQVLAGCALGH